MPDRSLAVSLTQSGYDAWLLDLRGHGDAIVHDGDIHGWTVDDYAGHDLQRAIHHIQEQTGSAEVAVVGHSMGGIVAAAYHGIHGDEALGALVVVGSPIDFSNPDVLLRLGQVGIGAGTALRRLRSEVPARWLSMVPGKIPLHGEGILFNGRNIEPSVRREMLRQIVSPMSREELAHFTQMIKAGRLTSADGSKDYVAELASLTTPLLVISGATDKVAKPSRVRPWIEASGSPNETYIEAGQESGMQEDYGHLDLALGDRAREEIHAEIIEWLDAHWSAAPTQSSP